MSIRHRLALISLIPATCLAITTNAEVASACDASYWDWDADPRVACLRTEKVTGGFEIRNQCEDPIEITPEDCDEPCSETLRIEADSSEHLDLPGTADNPDEDVEHVFTYRQAAQTGTITFGYRLNLCDDDNGGCSAAPIKGRRTPPVTAWLSLTVLTTLVALRRRQRLVR